jgi:hypothetical protein
MIVAVVLVFGAKREEIGLTEGDSAADYRSSGSRRVSLARLCYHAVVARAMVIRFAANTPSPPSVASQCSRARATDIPSRRSYAQTLSEPYTPWCSYQARNGRLQRVVTHSPSRRRPRHRSRGGGGGDLEHPAERLNSEAQRDGGDERHSFGRRGSSSREQSRGRLQDLVARRNSRCSRSSA